MNAAACRFLSLLLLSCMFAGCFAEKESLFEEDHSLPAHWPHSLADAAEKIDQRLTFLANATTADSPADGTSTEEYEAELRDLVGWIPEVAADTDMSEEQWLTIYGLCDVMRKHLLRSDVRPADIEEDFRRLQALLIESKASFPEETDISAEVSSETAAAADAETHSVNSATDAQASTSAELVNEP